MGQLFRKSLCFSVLFMQFFFRKWLSYFIFSSVSFWYSTVEGQMSPKMFEKNVPLDERRCLFCFLIRQYFSFSACLPPSRSSLATQWRWPSMRSSIIASPTQPSVWATWKTSGNLVAKQRKVKSHARRMTTPPSTTWFLWIPATLDKILWARKGSML